ncbi:MAG: hypothetical protein ACYSYV_03755 [Planctomycetota bacterium]
MVARHFFLSAAVLLLSGFVSEAVWGQGNRADIETETIDLEAVRQKIEMLGIRDDSLGHSEKPENWLKQRQEKVINVLIAGLDHKQRRVGLGCLKLLEGVENQPELVDTLVRIAGKPEHPIHVEAMYRLCEFAEDERAHKLLEVAWRNEQRFQDARWRARMAAAAGEKAAAVKLLVPLLKHEEDYEVMKTIQQLGEIGHEDAIGPLEKLRDDERWRIAVDAYLVLAKVDPQGHGLTEEQVHFLKESTFRTKANTDLYIKRWKELISLNRKQIRGLVLVNIRSDRPDPGLVLLQLWKDKGALPILRGLIDKQNRRRFQRRLYAAAYMDIEGTDKSIEDMADYVKKQSGRSEREWERDGILRAVGRSIMPAERKLEILLGLRRHFLPASIAKNLLYGFNEDEKAVLLEPLMTEETNWKARGFYVRAAALDKQMRFGKLVEITLDKLITAVAANEKIDTEAACSILDAAMKYSLPGSGKKAEALLGHPQRRIRIAAALPAALFGGNRTRALAILHETLWHEDNTVRELSASYLAEVPCLNDKEKRQREYALLSHIGQRSEDYAMRVLVSCAGQRTAEILLPILDEQDVPRAIYATWVLAQHSDEQVREKAIRRLTIYSMFFHQTYQAGSGIDFNIAPRLSFHQTTSSIRRQEQRGDELLIPKGRYIPSNLDEKEQEFSIRAYRHACLLGYRFHIYGLDMWRPRKTGWDQSHLPLLEVITREDPFIKVSVIKDKPVVHFYRRQKAAQAKAMLEAGRAFYIGLDNEKIESEKMPAGPYEGQADKTARFLIGLAQDVLVEGWQDNEVARKRAETVRQMFRNLTSKELVKDFSDELKERLISTSRMRGIGNRLKEAGFIREAEY